MFNLYAEYITRNVRLDELQAEIKIGRRDINNLRYVNDSTLMAVNKKKLKSLDEGEEESERNGLKLTIKKHKIMHPVSLLQGKQRGTMWK